MKIQKVVLFNTALCMR